MLSAMKILVIGNGGREHAIVWRLTRDAGGHELYCAPGNAGTAALAANLPIGAEDLPAIVAWAKANRPDLTVVGPEAPLCAGLTDLLEAEGLRVFGPSKAAARLEGSKAFAKEVMAAAGVPTARAAVFTDSEAAVAALGDFGLPVVIKADGLAAGKGVVIAQTRAEAEAAIRDMLDGGRFGAAGAEVLLEEFLEGEEASVFALCDGERVALLPAAQDHKRVNDGDEGPNTGGMGAYTPAPIATPEVMGAVRDQVVLPTLRELCRRGVAYRGVLFCGLMIGRTPEYLGKKIEGREMKLTALAIIIHPLLILAFSALAVAVPGGQAGITNPGFHGLSQVLYEFASSAANNGSGFEGLADNSLFWNVTTGLVMFFGRYLPIVLQLAIAGSLMKKGFVNESAGSLRTDTMSFSVILVFVVYIFAAMTFFPVLALGPIAEHLTLWG